MWKSSRSCQGLCKIKAEGDTYMTAFFCKPLFFTGVIDCSSGIDFLSLSGEGVVLCPSEDSKLAT